MSTAKYGTYSTALTAAHEVPADELRERLTEALFDLACVDAVLDDDRYQGQTRADAIQGLRKERSEANEAQDTAEMRLEEELNRPETTLDDLREAERQRDNALDRLAKVEPLLDAYSDTVAFARKFLSLAEASGVKPRHVRRVGGKKASTP